MEILLRVRWSGPAGLGCPPAIQTPEEHPDTDFEEVGPNIRRMTYSPERKFLMKSLSVRLREKKVMRGTVKQ